MDEQQIGVYRACTPVVDTQYGGESDRSPSMAIVEAVAEAADVDPTELPPLYEYVDPDAIDDLFANQAGAATGDAYLGFTVDSWKVFVRADGKIRVCDATQRIDPEPVFAGHTAD